MKSIVNIKAIPLLSIVCFIVLLLSSCSTMYIPSGVYTPMHKEAGEIGASVNVGLGVGFDGHVSYSPTKNVGLLMSGGHNRRSEMDNGVERNYFRNTLNLAPGLYYELTDGVVCEMYGGVGYTGFTANNNIANTQTAGTLNGEMYNFFIQPAFGYRNENVMVSLVTRVSNLNYVRTVDEQGINYFKGSVSFIEPGLNIAIGSEILKFNFQTGLSLPYGRLPANFGYVPFRLLLGLQFNFSTYSKSKPKVNELKDF